MDSPSSFKEYALDSGVKFKPGTAKLLRENRFKMWDKAFKPMLSRIKQARKILDFGCGQGDFMLFLARHTGAQIDGYEISQSQMEVCRDNCKGMEQIHLLDGNADLKEGYDLVFCNHVIEHIADAEIPEFVGKLTRPVGGAGKLVVTTPNGLNPFAHSFYLNTDRTHVRIYSPFSLAEVLRPCGFAIEEIRRELPQGYDALSYLKLGVWWVTSAIAKLFVAAVAGGVRGLKFPLTMASTFYVVAGRSSGQ